MFLFHTIAGCQDPFTPFQGRFAFGGEANAATSDVACAAACRSSTRTCYGYDWNLSGQCYLHLDLQNIDQSKLRSGTNVVHYRRQFTCSPTNRPPVTPPPTGN